MKTINELSDVVRETACAIHVYHGHGHLEKVGIKKYVRTDGPAAALGTRLSALLFNFFALSACSRG